MRTLADYEISSARSDFCFYSSFSAELLQTNEINHFTDTYMHTSYGPRLCSLNSTLLPLELDAAVVADSR